MSTDIFRKYIDLLNESVSDSELSQITQALGELERVLAKDKYKPKGLRSYFNEDEPPDPPFFAPGDESPAPKPRYKPGPNGTMLQQTASGEWVPVPPRPSPTANNPFGLRPGEAVTPAAADSLPLGTTPFTHDIQGRAIGPISTRASTGGTVTATPSGTVHTAPKPPLIRIPKVPAYTAIGAGLLYGAYELIHQLLKVRFSDLDQADQATIDKNLRIIEPYIKPEVLPTLPEQIQLRISTVLKMLEKLGKSSSSPAAAAAEKPVEKPTFDPADPWKKPSDTWTTDGTPTEEDIAKFKKLLQATRQNRLGVRESRKQSLDISQLSEAEKMAVFRDKLKEDGSMSGFLDAINPFTDDNAIQKLLAYTGLSTVTGISITGLRALWNKWLVDEPFYADASIRQKIPAFKNWIKLNYPTWIGAGKTTVAGAAVTFLMIKTAGYLVDWWKLDKAATAADQAVQDLPKQGNNETELYNQYLHMPVAYWNSLNSDDKDDIDEFLLSYCLKYTDAPRCSEIKNKVCELHSDWSGCQSWLKLTGKKPE